MRTISLYVAVIMMGCAFAQPFRPSIPKTWDEEAMRTMEIPLATPQASPVHISAERYYSIPEMIVFKTYPRRMPGKSEDEYFAWLRRQEPEVIQVDAAALPSKDAWVRAGKSVFEWPGQISGKDSAGTAARIVIRTKGKIEFGVSSCSHCHSRLMDDGSEIPGAQMNLTSHWKRPVSDMTARRATANRRFPVELSTPWLQPDPNALPDDMPAATFARLLTRVPSLAPRFHTSFWSPANIPSLIGVRDVQYLDRTGHTRHRSIGDLMRYAALNFGIGSIAATCSFGNFVPGQPIRPTLRRLSDSHLYALALYVYSLRPPANPNRLDTLASRGRKIFEREGCSGCHPAPLYTNNKLTPAAGFRIPERHTEAYDISPVSVGTDPWLAVRTRRGTGYYKVPPLRGVWYRGPFEHNGSVLTLEDWFDPARLRDDYVPTGWLGPNTVRAVRGHEFGLRLKSEERKALIAFLRTL